MAFEFEIPIGRGAAAASITASLEGLLVSLSPKLQKMSAKQLQIFMQPRVAKAFKEVVRKWKALLARKGIDSSWSKPNGEPHIADALIASPVTVSPHTSKFRKILEWEILSGADHLAFTLQGFGDVGVTEVSTWGRQASLAAWANNKFGWKIPISGGLVDVAAAKRVKVIFGGRETTAWGAIIALGRAVNDNRIRSYGLAEALDRFITRAIFRNDGLIGGFIQLASDFDDL